MSCDSAACVLGVFVSLFVLYKILDRLVRLPRIGGRYSDRFVLVTGCGQGFGFEAVKRLDRLGCHVFAGCRKQESVDKLRETFSDRVHPILMDVSDRDSVRKAFEYVSSQLPPNTGLWGLINNAGISYTSPMDLLTLEIYKEIMATNLFGAIDVTMTFLPLIKKARGRVVNVSSIAGRFAVPMAAPYTITKYGLEAFSDGLRRSLRAFGCKVLIIEPGAVKTHLIDPEKCLKEFEVAWRQAQSEGRINSSDDLEEVFRREQKKLSRQMSDLRESASIGDVIDAYEHALFGVFPRARYLVGNDAKIVLLLQMLPEWFSDWVISILLPTSVSYEARYLKET